LQAVTAYSQVGRSICCAATKRHHCKIYTLQRCTRLLECSCHSERSWNQAGYSHPLHQSASIQHSAYITQHTTLSIQHCSEHTTLELSSSTKGHEHRPCPPVLNASRSNSLDGLAAKRRKLMQLRVLKPGMGLSCATAVTCQS